MGKIKGMDALEPEVKEAVIIKAARRGRAATKYQSDYRFALREARVKAVMLAKKLVEMGLEDNGPINKDILDAMREILKDSREVLGKPIYKRKKVMGAGIPDDELKEALDELEGD